MDMTGGYAESDAPPRAPGVICIDPYHVVQLANQALDEVRRAYWNELRSLGDQHAAKRFKDARWALLKAPENLTDTAGRHARPDQGRRRRGMARLHTQGGRPRDLRARAQPRGRHDPDRPAAQSRLARSRLEPFVRLGKTIRKHRDGILAAIRLGINQGRTEALNNKVRLITRRAYGFHCAKAALALIMLTCGPITLHLPHELHALGIA